MPTKSIAQVEILEREISVKKLLKQRLIKFEDIPSMVSNNNLELKSLKKLVEASSFDL